MVAAGRAGKWTQTRPGTSADRGGVNGLRKLDTFGLRKLDTFSDRLAVPGGEFDGGMVRREGVPRQAGAEADDGGSGATGVRRPPRSGPRAPCVPRVPPFPARSTAATPPPRRASPPARAPPSLRPLPATVATHATPSGVTSSKCRRRPSFRCRLTAVRGLAVRGQSRASTGTGRAARLTGRESGGIPERIPTDSQRGAKRSAGMPSPINCRPASSTGCRAAAASGQRRPPRATFRGGSVSNVAGGPILDVA